jgi:hypothetical protein
VTLANFLKSEIYPYNPELSGVFDGAINGNIWNQLQHFISLVEVAVSTQLSAVSF